jgi:tetratricopeptide (TPR) repeat protein
MKLGAVLYEQKAYDRAIEAFQRALTLEPQNLRARFYLASSFLDAGREGEALESLNEVLRTDPKNVDARLQLGFLHSRAKRYDDAVRVLTEAANLDPRRPEIFLYLGMAHYRASNYDRAVRAYEEGLALDDAHKDLHFQLGVAFEKQGRFDQAVGQFRRVIALDPKHAEAYNYVGYMFAEKGIRLDEAERLIQKALEIEPENGFYIDSLGWAYYQQGRYGDAVRELRRAVELTRTKEDPVIFDHLGEAYLKAGDEPAALAAWEKSLELDPANESVRQKIQRARKLHEGRK